MEPRLEIAELARVAAGECASLVNRAIATRRAGTASEIADVRQAFHVAVSALESIIADEAISAEATQQLAEHLSSHPALESLRRELHEERVENQRLAAELDDTRTALERVRADLCMEQTRAAAFDGARISDEFDRTLDDLREEHLTTVREQALTYTSLPLDALLTIFNAMARAGSIEEVLTELVHGLAREFSRVILFTIHDNRLDAVEHHGFEFGTDVSKLSLPLSTDSLLSVAVRSGRLEAAFPAVQGESAARLPLGGTPACAVAIPFLVSGLNGAVVYADDSDTPEFAIAVPQTRAKFAEILQRHVSLLLLKTEAEQKEVDELREFAKLLVEEVEYLHAADVGAGKGALERQQALREVLARSRELWAERLGRGDDNLASLLDERLRAIAAARADTVFAGDLATAIDAGDRRRRGAVVTMRR